MRDPVGAAATDEDNVKMRATMVRCMVGDDQVIGIRCRKYVFEVSLYRGYIVNASRRSLSERWLGEGEGV